MRTDGRSATQMRPVKIHAALHPCCKGSVLIEVGRTRVICTASVEETVPAFLRNSGKGWVTSEYAMIRGPRLRVRPVLAAPLPDALWKIQRSSDGPCVPPLT